MHRLSRAGRGPYRAYRFGPRSLGAFAGGSSRRNERESHAAVISTRGPPRTEVPLLPARRVARRRLSGHGVAGVRVRQRRCPRQVGGDHHERGARGGCRAVRLRRHGDRRPSRTSARASVAARRGRCSTWSATTSFERSRTIRGGWASSPACCGRSVPMPPIRSGGGWTVSCGRSGTLRSCEYGGEVLSRLLRAGSTSSRRPRMFVGAGGVFWGPKSNIFARQGLRGPRRGYCMRAPGSGEKCEHHEPT